MKKSLLFLSLCLAVVSMKAKVIQVNNNVGANSDYSLLQKAIDNASSGDTIYVAGSPNLYDGGKILINKKVVIIGPGFFLGENGQNQSSNLTAKILNMELGEGGDNSVIMGLTFEGWTSYLIFSKRRPDNTLGEKTSNNVTLKRNKFSHVAIYYASGTIICQNYFVPQDSKGIFLDNTSSNTLVENNIINSGNSPSVYGYYDKNIGLTNTTISNNTMSDGLKYISGVNIYNNIFISDGLSNSNNNTLKNNIFTISKDLALPSTQTGNTESNNKYSVTTSDLFIKATPALDNEFKLKTNSPAVGAGIDGIDAGAFGGLNAYKLSGLPPIPSIYEVTTTGVGTKENGLKVVIKAKSNN